MVILKGPSGVGKSSIARAAIRYSIDRNFFRGGAYYVNGAITEKSMLQ